MLERELKFYVPLAQRTVVKQIMRTMDAKAIPMHARYFDTDHSMLAKAHIALRLRKEGRQWVQTVKMPGPDEVTRIELNHTRPGPELDLSVYQDTAVGQALAALDRPLLMRYETMIQRLVTTTDTKNGSVELAYDEGHIASGNTRIAVHELEFEHIKGGISGLFDLCRQWQARHGLILDYRSKAERGNALANHQTLQAPYVAVVAPANTDAYTPAVNVRLANAHLASVVRNAALLAGAEGVDPSASLSAACTKQLLVGIRELQSCWPTALAETLDQSGDLAASVRFQSDLLHVLEDLVQASPMG